VTQQEAMAHVILACRRLVAHSTNTLSKRSCLYAGPIRPYMGHRAT